MKSFRVTAWVLGGIAVAWSPALGQLESLNKCQKAVGKETGKYIRAVVDTVGKCLAKASSAVIVEGQTANLAASDCVKQLLKISNSAAPTKTLSAKLTAKLGKACDPAVNINLTHAEADTYTIGSATLSAANLNEHCTNFGGGGTIGDFDDWVDCIRQAADCQARQAIATAWPRALEYAEDLLADATITGNADALAALTSLDNALEGATNDNVPELACGPPQTVAVLLKTGQTQCDQGAGTMGACPGSPLQQDPAVGSGTALSYTDNGDGTISDNGTGLMWEKLDDNGATDGLHDKDAIFTWYDAFNRKIKVLNGDSTGCANARNPAACCSAPSTGTCSAFAGHSDWRVPNARELQTLVDMGRSSPAIDTAFNNGCTNGCTLATCSCTRNHYLLTSTTYFDNAGVYWAIDFSDGDDSTALKSFQFAGVRAVRGGL